MAAPNPVVVVLLSDLRLAVASREGVETGVPVYRIDWTTVDVDPFAVRTAAESRQGSNEASESALVVVVRLDERKWASATLQAAGPTYVVVGETSRDVSGAVRNARTLDRILKTGR